MSAKPIPTRPLASKSEDITAVLRDEILRGRYQAGDRLPSERELATRFSSARGPVREALKKLEQLGIASIQPGGARVVSINNCSLEVLGPLLDLNELPDPELVDQVLQVMGVLMGVAARNAINKASDDEIERAKQTTEQLLSKDVEQSQRYEALRELGQFFIEVSDHLILRLMMNGLQTTFWARLNAHGIHIDLDRAGFAEIVAKLRAALDQRNPMAVSDAMQSLNRFFRDGVRDALNLKSTAERKEMV